MCVCYICMYVYVCIYMYICMCVGYMGVWVFKYGYVHIVGFPMHINKYVMTYLFGTHINIYMVLVSYMV